MDKKYICSLIKAEKDKRANRIIELEKIPDGATDLFLSIGGNDVLQYKNVLTNNALTALEFLTNFADVLDKFKDRYRKMVTSLLKFDLPPNGMYNI